MCFLGNRKIWDSEKCSTYEGIYICFCCGEIARLDAVFDVEVVASSVFGTVGELGFEGVSDVVGGGLRVD